jgi:hypothetical protein
MPLDDITPALKVLRDRKPRYQEYAGYYDGRHPLAFATNKFRGAFGALFEAFADNLCPAVVDAVADRLVVTGFDVEEGSEQAADDAWGVWLANRMDRRAGEVHLEVLKQGDAYVIVWPDADGRPTIYPNPAATVTVTYDEEQPGRLASAAKVWATVDGTVRATLYYPDAIEKYATRRTWTLEAPSTAKAFEPYQPEGEEWPLKNPYGRVPVFHLANNAGIGEMGRSELRDVLPLQDALNKAHADRLVGMEYQALPQRWATGLEVPINPETGQPMPPFIPGADRVWTVGDPDVKFGQFDSADLLQIGAVIDDMRMSIARVSSTPLHYMQLTTGNFPSGESLKTAEAKFLSKVKDRQSAFGNVWEDVLAFCLKISGGQDARLSALWQDPAPRSEREHAETVRIKREMGITEAQALRELGYSDEQIARMQTERTEEIQRDQMLELEDLPPEVSQ